MKRFIAVILSVVLLITPVFADNSIDEEAVQTSAVLDLDIQARSCILLEEKTGQIIYAENEHEQMSPASISKIMTLILGFEAIEAGKISFEDIVTCSENVSSQPGSRVFLSTNEEISVDELFKCIAVASGNDAAVALAEHIAGSESAFAEMMNAKAKELGMENTLFQNCTGLDDMGTENVSTAYDISIMARELMKHEKIFDYTTIWMDTIRNGEFGLTNTNKLVRFYSGTTGLKTGSTDKAKYCVCATAKRDDMHLIAIVMGADSVNMRNEQAKVLLNYGFANYATVTLPQVNSFENICVLKGKTDFVTPEMCQKDTTMLINKAEKGEVTYTVELEQELIAPIEKGQKIGTINFFVASNKVASFDLTAKEGVERVTFGFNLLSILQNILF